MTRKTEVDRDKMNSLKADVTDAFNEGDEADIYRCSDASKYACLDCEKEFYGPSPDRLAAIQLDEDPLVYCDHCGSEDTQITQERVGGCDDLVRAQVIVTDFSKDKAKRGRAHLAAVK